jgi:hypothetical protein
MRKTFRFDDISLNTNCEKFVKILSLLKCKFPDSDVLLGISCLVHDMSAEEGRKQERIFPEILNAYSDHKVFYNVQKAGIPTHIIQNAREVYPSLKLAGHGLIHVDHRLLNEEAQEMSIIISCSLCNSDIFIPPFNKYNAHTEKICSKMGIKLVKFEDGWKHLLYNGIDEKNDKYYIHTHDVTIEQFEGKL